MFKKNKCHNCNSKVGNDYNFCPYCKAPLKSQSGEFGLLGKNDIEPFEGISLPRGMNTLINTLLKNLGRQMEDLERKNNPNLDKPRVKNRGLGISIYTSSKRAPEIRLTQSNKDKEIEEETEIVELPTASHKKFLGLPKKAPKTDLRRFSDKLVYEINLPGVKSIEDISMIQLENSIELKALAKDFVFHKIIPISLPIRDYDFSNKKFTLELDIQE